MHSCHRSQFIIVAVFSFFSFLFSFTCHNNFRAFSNLSQVARMIEIYLFPWTIFLALLVVYLSPWCTYCHFLCCVFEVSSLISSDVFLKQCFTYDIMWTLFEYFGLVLVHTSDCAGKTCRRQEVALESYEVGLFTISLSRICLLRDCPMQNLTSS